MTATLKLSVTICFSILLRGRYCDSDKESSRTPDEERMSLVLHKIRIKLAVEVASTALHW